MTYSVPSSPNSLFDDLAPDDSGMSNPSSPGASCVHYQGDDIIASRSTPPVDGLYVFPDLLPWDVANDSLQALAEEDIFMGGTRDQVMLFSNLSTPSLPTHTTTLLSIVRDLLSVNLPEDAMDITFNQNLARQVIYNLYPPGEGISPHVDLPNRYADGIVGVSLTGGCVMQFTKSIDPRSTEGSRNGRFNLYLPPRSVYVLTREARWGWAHGIDGRFEDVVEQSGNEGSTGKVETILRGLRVSVTFRWMKKGADILV